MPHHRHHSSFLRSTQVAVGWANPGLAACTHHWRQRLRCGLQGHAGHHMEDFHCITPPTSSILSNGNHIQRKKIWQNTLAKSWQSEMLGKWHFESCKIIFFAGKQSYTFSSGNFCTPRYPWLAFAEKLQGLLAIGCICCRPSGIR